jgi:Bacterial Ig-like domain (group 3)
VTPAAAPTTTTLTVNPTTIKTGASATITIAVKASSGGTPTGNVSLLDGSTVLATVALSGGKASFSASTKGYAVGTYVLHATYAGSSTDAASTSSNVTVTITN